MEASFTFSGSAFAGVVALERMFPRRARAAAAHAATVALLLALPAALVLDAPAYVDLGIRVAALALAARLTLLALEAYARSRTYDAAGAASSQNVAARLTLRAAALWDAAALGRSSARIGRLAAAVPATEAGRRALARLGISPAVWRAALASPNLVGAAPLLVSFFGPLQKEITLGDLIVLLAERMESVRQALLDAGVSAADAAAASSWAERDLGVADRKRRWWLPEALARRGAVGGQWAYGRTFYLSHFAREITGGIPGSRTARRRELALLEEALGKQAGANALLVGDPGSGKKTIVSELALRIGAGGIAGFEHERVLMFAGSMLAASARTKGEIEALLAKILAEADRAGNIVLVIDQFPEFVASLASLGVSAGQIFGPFLSSASLRIVALADTIPYRRVLASDAGLLAHFETVHLDELRRDQVIAVLEQESPELERDHRDRTAITYQTVRAVADAAVNVMTEGALPKRAIELLAAAVAAAAAAGDPYVLPAHVSGVITEKTHMPTGAIAERERDVLVNLEALLRRRVIGQDEAIAAIANTIRRARAAVRNPKRPIGSFLFLGPTGVGKTESAKALAAAYFGDEEAMTRFDMTEYQTEEDVAKLLGSAERSDPGLLAARIRRSPYGIVLLDEFEKSHPDVRNLFLQILDEGFFSDALGERVNMRSTIIIATSNAAALLIQDLVKQNKDLAREREAIIETAEKEARLAPELLNRFDSLIIFRPLDPETRRAVARLMLTKLASRLSEQNYLLDVTPELADAVASGGYDPKFGARPMQRWIQDHVEKAVSDGILAGTVITGKPFRVDAAESRIAG